MCCIDFKRCFVNIFEPGNSFLIIGFVEIIFPCLVMYCYLFFLFSFFQEFRISDLLVT